MVNLVLKRTNANCPSKGNLRTVTRSRGFQGNFVDSRLTGASGAEFSPGGEFFPHPAIAWRDDGMTEGARQ
jgi:hypothetical protein